MGSGTGDRTVADVGEFAVIARATYGRGQPAATLLGPGDDAAVVATPDGRVVATTDMLVEGRHFTLDWSAPIDVGRKAIAQNGADIAAMGAYPTGYLVALACPATTRVAVIDGLVEGMWQEAATTEAGIVGGDLVAADAIVLSVTALGDLRGRPPVLRSGARSGDVVAVFGRLGHSAAGHALLRAGRQDFPGLIAAHRIPAPPYAQGPVAATAGATAMTDVSDGLLADLGHLASASGVHIDVHSRDLAADPALAAAATKLAADRRVWQLTGGEDHALVATFPADTVLPPRWRAIGTVGDGEGVTVDGQAWRGPRGWESFTAG